jgi:hypothetical protein
MPETDPSFQEEQIPMPFHSNNSSPQVVFQVELNLEDPEDLEHPVDLGVLLQDPVPLAIPEHVPH